MALSSNVVVDIVIACVCMALILSRCTYRMYQGCKRHTAVHRLWHADDVYLTIAILPLVARTVCVCFSFSLNPSHSRESPTEADAAAQNTTIEKVHHDRVVSFQLLFGTRLGYTLYLWCLKAALLSFYSRFVRIMSWSKVALTALWWLLGVSCIIVVIAALVECRPISLMWKLGPEETRSSCTNGMMYFVSMAVCNIVTDIALLILPFPTLTAARLNLKSKIRLGVLFSVGILLIIITIVRVPLILNDSLSQKSRSTWATIEILCGSVVVNAPFLYGLIRDFRQKKNTQPTVSDPSRTGGRFYLQSKGHDRLSNEMGLDNMTSVENISARELII